MALVERTAVLRTGSRGSGQDYRCMHQFLHASLGPRYHEILAAHWNAWQLTAGRILAAGQLSLNAVCSYYLVGAFILKACCVVL